VTAVAALDIPPQSVKSPPLRAPETAAADPFRGMASRESWRQSPVHRHSLYFCGKCGRRFRMPHDVYAHLDAKHPKRKLRVVAEDTAA
jgi:hypothetical protein